MRERDIEKYLVERVKALGGEVRKVQWIGRRGAPDRLVMLPAKHGDAWDGNVKAGAICCANRWTLPAQTIWVELKATGKQAEPHQVREMARMVALGQTCVVVDSKGMVDALLS